MMTTERKKLSRPTPLRAYLDEITIAGVPFSRRPRIRCEAGGPAGGGLEFERVANERSPSLVAQLCRDMVGAGIDPLTPLEVYRGETLAFHVRSIGAGAELTIVESSLIPIRWRKFVPFHRPGNAFGAENGEGCVPMHPDDKTHRRRPGPL